MAKIIVSGLKESDFTPKLDDPAAQALLPKKFRPGHLEFVLEGAHVGIANGLRRVIGSEVPVKALYFELDDFECTEPYMLNDFVSDRIRQIPIDQSVPDDARFELNVVNTGPEMLVVSSAEIRAVGPLKGGLPFNETFTVVKIGPGKHIKIKNIRIMKGYGYDYGGYNVAQNVLARALDQEPFNFYTNKGTSSLVSDPRKYFISFNTNGTMEPRAIVRLACDEIIRRYEQLKAQLVNIYSSSDGTVHILAIGGENHTTGNAIIKTIVEQTPEVCTFKHNPTAKLAEWSLKTGPKSPAPAKIFEAAINYCIGAYEQIKKQI